MSLDSLWSAPVSLGTDQPAAEAAALVSETQLSSAMMHEAGAQKYSSPSDTLMPDVNSRIGSVQSPVASVSAKQSTAKPPSHTAVHGMPIEFSVQCWLRFCIKAGIPRHRHRHRLAKHGYNLTSDTRYFLVSPREEIVCVGRKIVAMFGEFVSASWNASLRARSARRQANWRVVFPMCGRWCADIKGEMSLNSGVGVRSKYELL